MGQFSIKVQNKMYEDRHDGNQEEPMYFVLAEVKFPSYRHLLWWTLVGRGCAREEGCSQAHYPGIYKYVEGIYEHE